MNSRAVRLIFRLLFHKYKGVPGAKRRYIIEQMWRAGEVFGLWAAAIVGTFAVVYATRDADQQREQTKRQVEEMIEQRGQMKLQVQEMTEQRKLLSKQIDEMHAQRKSVESSNNSQMALFTKQMEVYKTEHINNIEQQRANIVIGSIDIYPIKSDGSPISEDDHNTKADAFMVSPNIYNTGPTEAKQGKAWWHLLVLPNVPKGKDPTCPKSSDADQSKFTKVNSLTPSESRSLHPEKVLLADAERARHGKADIVLLAIGHVDYNDIFFPESRPHRDNWCQIIVPFDPENGKFQSYTLEEDAE